MVILSQKEMKKRRENERQTCKDRKREREARGIEGEGEQVKTGINRKRWIESQEYFERRRLGR